MHIMNCINPNESNCKCFSSVLCSSQSQNLYTYPVICTREGEDMIFTLMSWDSERWMCSNDYIEQFLLCMLFCL